MLIRSQKLSINLVAASMLMFNVLPASAMVLPVEPPTAKVAPSTPVPLGPAQSDRADILASVLVSMARAAEEDGQTKQAIALYQAAWDIRKESGVPTINSAIAAGRLSYLYARSSKLYLAEILAKQSLQDVISVFGTNCEVAGIGLNNLATIEETLKHFGYAEKLYKESIEAARGDGESALETVAIAESNLGDLYWKQNKIDKALELYNRALNDLRQFSSGSDPEIARVQSKLDKIRHRPHR